jgi:hypothetical protein
MTAAALVKARRLRLELGLMAEVEEWVGTVRPRPPMAAAARKLITEGLASFKRKTEDDKPAKARK